MKNTGFSPSAADSRFKRNVFWFGFLSVICLVLISSAGCPKKVPPKSPYEIENERVLANRGRLIGDLTHMENMTIARLHGVALVEGLDNTGVDEPESSLREMVFKEMQTDPEMKKIARDLMASTTTAIVTIEAIIPPGVQEGDKLDVIVRLPPDSDATSLAGGFIRKAYLREYDGSSGVLHYGYDTARVTGPILLDPEEVAKQTNISLTQGTIISGATIMRDRPVWLQLKPREACVGNAKKIEDSINSRFNYRRNGVLRRVATAGGEGTRVDVVVPPEYKENVNRYMNVLGAISFFETNFELQERVKRLAIELKDPEQAESVALQLEAIGKNDKRVSAEVLAALREGMKDSNLEVRYHSAIAMAYLSVLSERANTAQCLGQIALENKEYRAMALSVLGTCMKSSSDVDNVLRNLLSVNSIETRYGAFRALWTRNPQDYMIQGEILNNQFSYHIVNVAGTPIIHVTKKKRPEIVLFSKDIYLQGTFNLDAGSRITVRSEGGNVIVKRYNTGLDESRLCDFQVDSVIRAIVDVGGTYPDVVELLVNAKKNNVLICYDTQSKGVTDCTLAIETLPGQMSSFKRLKNPLDQEQELTPADVVEKKPSTWSKINPVNWFTSEKKEGQTDSKESKSSEFAPPSSADE